MCACDCSGPTKGDWIPLSIFACVNYLPPHLCGWICFSMFSFKLYSVIYVFALNITRMYFEKKLRRRQGVTYKNIHNMDTPVVPFWSVSARYINIPFISFNQNWEKKTVYIIRFLLLLYDSTKPTGSSAQHTRTRPLLQMLWARRPFLNHLTLQLLKPRLYRTVTFFHLAPSWFFTTDFLVPAPLPLFRQNDSRKKKKAYCLKSAWQVKVKKRKRKMLSSNESSALASARLMQAPRDWWRRGAWLNAAVFF